MPEIPIISAKRFLAALLKYGCVAISINGSHHKVKNPKNGKVSVVPIHGNGDLKRALFVAVLNQLEIDIYDFLGFIGSHK
jgi:predicted RNA binding protein YcfA (HicA-like mRNA interferase family)